MFDINLPALICNFEVIMIDYKRIKFSERGLTLLEIMVVLLLLGFLFTVLVKGIFPTGEKAKARLNIIQMNKLQSAIQEYQLMNNTLPPSLDALVNCPADRSQACIPVAGADLLKDVWGTPFGYQASGNSYTIKSLGADRRDGGEGLNADMIITGP
jgi:general secretion pathway protein G